MCVRARRCDEPEEFEVHEGRRGTAREAIQELHVHATGRSDSERIGQADRGGVHGEEGQAQQLLAVCDQAGVRRGAALHRPAVHRERTAPHRVATSRRHHTHPTPPRQSACSWNHLRPRCARCSESTTIFTRTSRDVHENCRRVPDRDSKCHASPACRYWRVHAGAATPCDAWAWLDESPVRRPHLLFPAGWREDRILLPVLP